MSAIPCPACEAETPDGLLCRRCSLRCRRDLETIARIWPELEVTLSRQARTGSGGKRTDPSPLPIDAGAFKTRSYVGNQLSTWVRELDLGDTAGLSDDPRAWALWLAERTERIRAHEAADEIVGEFGYCVTLVWRAVDLPAQRVYCGACETCGADLMARHGATEVVCQRCERAGVVVLPVVNVEARRDEMRARLEDVLATRDEVLGAVPEVYGVTVSRKTLASWISRGRLSEVGGRVRVGDVLDLAAGVSRTGT